MRRKYFYFCSEGSIYTVSTVGKRGRRMGKYMKKSKSVQNMEVSQSALLGVRTRARALALDKQTSERPHKHCLTSTSTISKPHKRFQSRTSPPKNEPNNYMQLRSRRLEKIPKHKERGKKFAEDTSGDQASAADLTGSSIPSYTRVELSLYEQELLDVPPRNSCSSRPPLASATIAPSTDALSNSRATSPAQSRGILGRATSSMLTRNQKLEFNSKQLADSKAMETDIDEKVTPTAASPSTNGQSEMEDEPCFGESPMITGPSSRERQQGLKTHSQIRESTLNSLIRDVEGPGSTSRMRRSSQIRSSSAPPFSRSNESPPSTEIEAFFSTAEQKERRRFIDRYNFDPLTEKPLKGRYLWLKE